jgi:hypothetical protein
MTNQMLSRAAKTISEDGFYSLLQKTSHHLGRTLSCIGVLGENVFTREWDVLIVLDTCRFDALQLMSNEYDFLNNISSIYSVGGASVEWIMCTFSQRFADKISSTAYLSNNPYAEKVLEESFLIHPEVPSLKFDTVKAERLGALEHIWKYKGLEREATAGHAEGYIPPRYVTDRGIAVGRTNKYNRIILHYMQPHSPYTSNAIKQGRELEIHERHPFDYLRKGGERNIVFGSYLDDLRNVLDEIEILLKNINAEKVVISADHGEAFGEYNGYAHTMGSLNPFVRKVPWANTTATDQHTRIPEIEPTESSKRDIDELLAALGYQ